MFKTKIKFSKLAAVLIALTTVNSALAEGSYASDRAAMNNVRPNLNGSTTSSAGNTTAGAVQNNSYNSEPAAAAQNGQNYSATQNLPNGYNNQAALPQTQNQAVLPQPQNQAVLPQTQNQAVLPQTQNQAVLPQTQNQAVLPQTQNQSQHTLPQTGAQQHQTGGNAPLTAANMTATLFKQAQFWHDKQQLGLAKQNLNRVLLTEPNNADALYLMSLWSMENGDVVEAERWKTRFIQAAPRDPRIQSLNDISDLSSLSKEQLNHARELAASGNIPAALVAYEKIFKNGNPPRSLASEYYLTMSGDPNRYNEAVTKLVQYIRQTPNDDGAKISYGKLLTYRDGTRRQGIELLQYYAPNTPSADEALRQALLWMAPESSDEKYYRNYMQRHPNDTEIARKFNSSLVDSINSQAFNAISAQHDKEAEQAFMNVLQRDPTNLAALEGLGYLYMRQQNYKNASLYLSRAAEIDSPKKSKLHFDALMAGAHQAEKDGDYNLAQNLADQMINLDGSNATDLRLFKANLYRKMRQFKLAEEQLQTILSSDPTNAAALENLYYIYLDDGKKEEAQRLFNTMSPSLQATIKSRQGPAYVDPTISIRKNAQKSYDSGNYAAAIESLQQSLQKYPNSPWLRYDLAKALKKSGDDFGAQNQLGYLLRQGANNESLFAAASLQSEWGDYQGANSTLSRISSGYNTKGLRTLRNSIKTRSVMSEAEKYIKMGQKGAAINTLNTLKSSISSMSTVDLGHLAYLYLQAGDRNAAVSYADQAYSRGISNQASIGDFADVVSVYNATGNYQKAQTITANSSIVANSKQEDLNRINQGKVIQQADMLRRQGRSADAYDLLFMALQNSPQDPDLMMAMARLYQDNERFDDAENIYDRVILNHPDNQSAIEGGIYAAIGAKHGQKVVALASRLTDSNDPNTLIIKALAAKENNDYKSAINYLRQSKSILEGTSLGSVDPATSEPYTHTPNNPFRNTHALTAPNKVNPTLLPWEQMPDGSALAAPSYRFDTSYAERSKQLNEVNDLLSQLYDASAVYVKTELLANQKKGEKGLSTVNGFSAPITISMPISGDNRLTATVTPSVMDAGTPNADSSYKVGTNAFAVSSNAMNDAVHALMGEIKYRSTQADYDTYKQNLAKSLGISVDAVDLLNATDYGQIDLTKYNLTTDEGVNNFNSLLDRLGIADRATLSRIMSAYGSVTGSRYVVSNKQHRGDGVEFDLAFTGNSYGLDVGVTPVGKKGTTFVGGFNWHPNITSNLQFRFNAERRAIRDSVLSFYGLKDIYSGTTWGAVVKTGGNIGLAYDNGYMGAYGSVGYYRYTGEKVKSNYDIEANAGIYTRILNEKDQQITVGLNLQYMNFKDNHNRFSLGYGGYFSPQDYYAAAIPINYHRKMDKLDVNVGASIGYQRYNNEGGAYFPTNSLMQENLDILRDSGVISESRYSNSDKSGIGGSFKISADYHVNDAFRIGGYFNYDTFGEYKQYSEMLYFKYLLGVL